MIFEVLGTVAGISGVNSGGTNTATVFVQDLINSGCQITKNEF